jgi:hypothetical protein
MLGLAKRLRARILQASTSEEFDSSAGIGCLARKDSPYRSGRSPDWLKYQDDKKRLQPFLHSLISAYILSPRFNYIACN